VSSPLNGSIRGPQYLKTPGCPILKNFGNEGRREITVGRNIRPSQLPLVIVYNNTLAQKIVGPKGGENYMNSAVNYIWPELQKPSKS